MKNLPKGAQSHQVTLSVMLRSAGGTTVEQFLCSSLWQKDTDTADHGSVQSHSAVVKSLVDTVVYAQEMQEQEFLTHLTERDERAAVVLRPREGFISNPLQHSMKSKRGLGFLDSLYLKWVISHFLLLCDDKRSPQQCWAETKEELRVFLVHITTPGSIWEGNIWLAMFTFLQKIPSNKKELNCLTHLDNADRFPGQMVGRVEEEGEEENEAAIPADDISKQRPRVLLFLLIFKIC